MDFLWLESSKSVGFDILVLMAKRWDPGNHENELRLPEKDHGWIKESVVIPDGVLRSLPGGMY